MSTIDEKRECPILKELLKHLKSKSKGGISLCLERIKNEPKCYKQFAKDGGLGILVNLLRFHNLKILNMTLSILANACMASDARQKVRGSKIATHVVSIIIRIKLGNTLQCRACRLIGNLSECNWHARSLCQAGAIQALVDLLQLDTNMQTYLMGVRAIRNIWSMYEGSREEIIESEIIFRITELLVMAKEKLETDAKYIELVETCLKALCAFLVTLNPRVAEQVQGEKYLQGYKCIIQCCERNNKIAVKCLFNLCQIAECRPILGNSGVIESLIAIIIKNHPGLCKETLASLCLLCREAVNRARIRLGSGLELMLSLLQNPEYEKYHPMLLHALVQFVYDDPSIVIMIKHGLLDVLVTRLRKMVTEAVANEETYVSKKRGNDSSPNRQTQFKYNKTNLGRFSSDYYRDDWSPGSATSASSSPPSTPPLPFYDSVENDENAEDNYSPVCSDTEFMDNEDEEVESLKSCKSVTIDVDPPKVEECQNSENSNRSNCCDVWTLILLSQLSHWKDPIERLADQTTIEALSSYIKHVKNPKASRILTRIIRNRAYLLPLLKQGFVFEAQTLYDSEQYTKQLCTLAQTSEVINQFKSILRRGDETHKLVIAISIPFLMKNKYDLKSLLDDYGGLALIFRVLSDQQHNLHENAIWSICRLADTLQIQPEIIDKCQVTDIASTDFPRVYDSHPKPAMVTFELDDGTTVDACRHTLCQKSDTFSAMLEGNFSESGKKRVKLRNTSKEALDTLLLATYGATFENRTIESLLDAALLADKFLMPDILDILTESSVSKLNYKNINRVWNWARANSCHELKSFCVKHFLTATITKSERIQAFHDFSINESFREFLNDVRAIINNVLLER